ncbi:MAG: DUF1508 domain-containing protein [bacterium]
MSVRDKWEYYRDKKKEWRWTRTANNGEIVGAATEGYVRRIDCLRNAYRNGYEGGDGSGTRDKWEIYKDRKNEYRWRRYATNGNVVGASTEGYINRADCVANMKRHNFPGEKNARMKS